MESNIIKYRIFFSGVSGDSKDPDPDPELDQCTGGQLITDLPDPDPQH
jgi:hypothetical protein